MVGYAIYYIYLSRPYTSYIHSGWHRKDGFLLEYRYVVYIQSTNIVRGFEGEEGEEDAVSEDEEDAETNVPLELQRPSLVKLLDQIMLLCADVSSWCRSSQCQASRPTRRSLLPR